MLPDFPCHPFLTILILTTNPERHSLGASLDVLLLGNGSGSLLASTRGGHGDGSGGEDCTESTVFRTRTRSISALALRFQIMP